MHAWRKQHLILKVHVGLELAPLSLQACSGYTAAEGFMSHANAAGASCPDGPQ